MEKRTIEEITDNLIDLRYRYSMIKDDASQIWTMQDIRDDICAELSDLSLILGDDLKNKEISEVRYKISVERRSLALEKETDEKTGKLHTGAKADKVASSENAALHEEYKTLEGITKRGRLIMTHYNLLQDSIKQRISNIKKTEIM